MAVTFKMSAMVLTHLESRPSRTHQKLQILFLLVSNCLIILSSTCPGISANIYEVDRLSRPTKSSARRAATSKTAILERINKLDNKENSPIPIACGDESIPKSGTSATLRKTSRNIRSAMSALIAGRRRDSSKIGKIEDISAPSVEEHDKTIKSSGITFHQPTHPSVKGVTFAAVPTKPVHQSTHGSLSVQSPRNQPANKKNARVSFSLSGTEDWKSQSSDKKVDEPAPWARKEAEALASQVHNGTNTNRSRTSSMQKFAPGGRGYNEAPNTPPASGNSNQPFDNYAEDENPLRDRFNESLPGVTEFLNDGLRGAEDGLFRVVGLIDTVSDMAVRDSLLKVVGALETSIAATREARMANITLHENVAALVNLTAQVAARAVKQTVIATGSQ